MDLKELKIKSKALKPSVQIGKNGINEQTIAQIALHLKAHKLTKVKLNANFLDAADKQKTIDDLAEQLNATIVDAIGNVVVFYKR